ncbi:TolC family protein [Bacteroides sp. OttesenSCG-928-D19]|nr:TolC family protein [Bacteroides sp. OttesenSCG-928-N06]MDL2305304.1 TolC family protein [Bacteroides sp. OttesenSCG-928-D19]
MSKPSFLITAVIMSLWVCNARAQEKILTIDELFRLTNENSKSIRISQTALSQAAEAVAVAKTNRLPSVDVSLSASYMGDGRVWDRDFTNGMKAPIPHFGNNFSIEVSQVIYGGGAISAGIETVGLQRQIAELNVQNNSQNARFLVLGYYLELYKLNNQSDVYRKNIARTELLLEHIRARRAEGVALQNDITRYELQLEQLRLGLTELRNNASIINFQLVSTLALPEETIIVPDSMLLAMEIPALSGEQWQQQAEALQPGLKIADLSVSLGRQQERITRSERLPKVALVAANHLTGPVTIEIPALNKNFNYWYVGIGVQYNIGSLWKSQSKSRMNHFATVRAEQSLGLEREETEIAVNSAYTMLRQAYEQVRTQEKSVDLAVQNYKVINNRYLNDLALLTDMIDASNQQLAAELSLANARINVIYNYYKLKRVTGTL